MKKIHMAWLIPTLLAAGLSQAAELEKTYFNQKDLPSDTQGSLQASVSLAQNMIMPTANRLEGDRFPHLVSLRKTLVIFEPKEGAVGSDEQVTLTAKNAQSEMVYQAVMLPPAQQPRLVGQTEVDFVVERPEKFDRIINEYDEISSISHESKEHEKNLKQKLTENNTLHIALDNYKWAKHFTLPDDPAFDGKVITFTSKAAYTAHIHSSRGEDYLAYNGEHTYTNSKGIWYTKDDEAINEIAYSDKAYTAILPAEVLTPGLQLDFITTSGKEGALDSIKIGANTKMLINTIDIGLLTEPRDHFLFAKQHKLQREYFQNMSINQLMVNQYEAIHLTEIMLPDGRSFTDHDPGAADHYGSDSHYRVARELISAGINTANYGLNSSYVRSNTSWNIDPPYHAVQITVNMSRGKYASGFINHGSLGSYRGVASVANSTGNEFSHEVGHEIGVGGHYPGGILGAHNRSTELNSTWGWNPFSHLFVPNFSSEVNNKSTCIDGQCIAPFEGRFFGKGTMSGGFPLYPDHNAYTFSPPYEASIFQDFMENKANFELSSPTGFVKWNNERLEMEPWVNSLNDDLWVRRSTIGSTETLGQFGPDSTKMFEIYNDLNINVIYFNMGDGYWTKHIHLISDPSFEGKTAIVESYAGYTSYLHFNGTSRAINRNQKVAYQFTDGQWVEVDKDIFDKKVELTPETKGTPVTTIVGFYDPEAKLPTYIYPALHGAFGYTYADQMTTSGCQLHVLTREGGTKTFNLHHSRLTSNMMNRFHVNVETALKPYQAEIICDGKVLDSKALAAPTASLSLTKVSTQISAPPVIKGAENLTLIQGQDFDSKEGVSAFDDNDGDVSDSLSVEGLVDTQKAGDYQLIYKASDSQKNQTLVTRIVTVLPEIIEPETPEPPTEIYPPYQAGTAYQAGDIVTGKDGELYQCKDWPNSGWCPIGAYEPGVTIYWQDAWNKL